MDFVKLQYFVCFCECGSITKAAQKMHITAQGISKAILSVEEECGVPLVNRSNRTLTLTEEGKYFLDRAKMLLSSYNETLDHLLEISRTAKGKVKVGLAYGVIPAIGVEIFSDFQKNFPDINIELFEMEDKLMEEEVVSGKLHLGFTIGLPDSSTLESKFFHRRNQVILCSTKNPLSNRRTITFSDLKGQKMILLKDTFKKNSFIREHLMKEGIEILPLSGISEMNTIVSLCRSNAGIGICAEGIAGIAEDKTIVSIPFEEEDFFWDIHLISLPKDQLSYPTKLLRNYLLKYSDTDLNCS